MTTLDRRFSDLVRNFAEWRCAGCGAEFYADDRGGLHCSHFWSRNNQATRFDLENCDALCWLCHDRFSRHPEEYRDWKLERLGRERFDALAERARQIIHPDISAIRARIRELEARRAA